MRTLIALIIVIATSVAANAQFMINPVIGVNTFVLASDPPVASPQVSVGWTLGLNARIGNHFFFEPGIHYLETKNGLHYSPKTEGGEYVEGYDYKDDISMLKIPLLFGYKLIGTKDGDALVNLNIHAGLTPGFLLSATDQASKQDQTQYYNSFALALTGGVGLDILFLTLDVDADLGMTNVYSDKMASANFGPNSSPILFGNHKSIGVRVNLGFKYQFETDESKKKDQ